MIQNLQKSRFLLVSIVPSQSSESEAFKDISETIFLIESLDGIVVDIVLQNREIHDKGKYIGQGKIQEISQSIKEKNIQIVVLNASILPGQIYGFVEQFSQFQRKVEVWDRVDLILKIFASRAKTTEAKLQIELAAMSHMGPRIFGMGLEMSRQGGGIGTRGIGETNTERMKRHWRDEVKKTRGKLKKLAQTREVQIQRRQELGIKTVSLIGYTNAGKTSLFNLLTGKNKLAEGTLFATLDSYTGPLYLPQLKQEVLLTDTIGFIRDLPPQLIDAFTSTLLESINSDLLLHIIDSSDQDIKRKIEVVDNTLKTLKVSGKKIIYVFSKIDKALVLAKEQLEQEYKNYRPVFVSATQNKGITELLNLISQKLIQ